MTGTLLKADDRVHPDLDGDVLAGVHAFMAPAMSTTLWVPGFGTAAWLDLVPGDPAREYSVIRAAVGWWSSMVFGAGVPASLLEREVARRIKAAAVSISGARDWRAAGFRSEFESRAVITARRAQPITPVRCTARGCTSVVSVPHPLPALSTVRCPRHRNGGRT
jgi:hypothetical protein